MSDKNLLDNTSRILNGNSNTNQSKIFDRVVESVIKKTQELLIKPTIDNRSFPYNYEDKENRDALIIKREKYIIKALEKVLHNKKIIKKMLIHGGEPLENINIRDIMEEINQILSRDHKLDNNTSPEIIEGLEKEYNFSSVKKIILNYLGTDEYTESIATALKRYL